MAPYYQDAWTRLQRFAIPAEDIVTDRWPQDLHSRILLALAAAETTRKALRDMGQHAIAESTYAEDVRAIRRIGLHPPTTPKPAPYYQDPTETDR